MIGLSRDDLVDRRRLGRIRLGGLHAAPGGAGAPGDDRAGVLGHPFQLFDEGLAAVDAVHAAFVERRIAFDRENILAFVFLLGLLEDGFGLMAGGGHESVVVIERDHRQHDILDQRMRRADEAFRAAGAFQPVHPDHRHARLGFQRLRDLGRTGRAKAHAGGGERTEFGETPARDPLPADHVVKCLGHGHETPPARWFFAAPDPTGG